MHNWRCAGSTLNSLFASNFGDLYLKIGTQFSNYGWPLYELPEKLTLSEVRGGLKDGGIVGGHLCSGIDSLIPGESDLWLNARKPINRLSSGIVRFHAKEFSMPAGIYKVDEVVKNSEKVLDNLMSGPLRHEHNGVAKRLAGLSIADSFSVHPGVNLETLSCFEYSGSMDDLLKAALHNVNKIKIIIIPEHLHISMICIEKVYGLSPIINLFSDLRHNSSSLSKGAETDKKAFGLVKEKLRRMCSYDEMLWKVLSEKFHEQVASCKIDKRSVAARHLLHNRQILNPRSYSINSSGSEAIESIARSLADICKLHNELADEIIRTATSWNRFVPAAAEEISQMSRHFAQIP